MKEEFDLLGARFEERGKITDEYLAAFQELGPRTLQRLTASERAGSGTRDDQVHGFTRSSAAAPQDVCGTSPPLVF
jgi:hypothetical protein